MQPSPSQPSQILGSSSQSTGAPDPSSQSRHVARHRFLHVGESQGSKRRVDVLAGDGSSFPSPGSQSPPLTPSRGASSLRVLSPSVRIHILRDGRLTDADVSRLSSLAQSLGALVLATQHLSNLVLCSVKSAKRVEKYLEDEVRKDRVPVLHYEWLEECARKRLMQPFAKFWVAPEGSPSRTLDMGHLERFGVKRDLEVSQTQSQTQTQMQTQTQTQTQAEPPVKSESLLQESETLDTQSTYHPASTQALNNGIPPSPPSRPSPTIPGKQEPKENDTDDEDEEVVLLPTLASKVHLGKRPREDSGDVASGSAKRIEEGRAGLRGYTDEGEEDDDHGSRDDEEGWDEQEEEPISQALETRLGGTSSSARPNSAGIGSGASSQRSPPYRNVAYACYRPSPLVCVNQDLIQELDVLRLSRSFAGPHNTHQSASYSRAISAVKAFPEPLAQQPTMARRLKGVGKKIAMLIEQYYAEGHIVEATQIRSDRSFHLMCEFTELYGIGPKRARDLYQQGCRSLEDVVRTGTSIANSIPMDECLRILPDLRCRIPRREVEYIAELIQMEMDAIREGTIHTICGGYRRGKPESNDVDIVMTLPSLSTGRPQASYSGDEQRRILDSLLWALKRKGLMTHAVRIGSDRYELTASRVDVACIVFLPLAKKGLVDVPRHRRVDLIFCHPDVYGAAILGWTGSRQFEKDIRRLAAEKGYRFHSSGLAPLTSRKERGNPEVTPREEDVFRILDLEYMPPELRNCDA